MKTLQQLCIEAATLCQEIEKLPAGDQQTKVSTMAAQLAWDMRDLDQRTIHVSIHEDSDGFWSVKNGETIVGFIDKTTFGFEVTRTATSGAEWMALFPTFEEASKYANEVFPQSEIAIRNPQS